MEEKSKVFYSLFYKLVYIVRGMKIKIISIKTCKLVKTSRNKVK